MSLFLENAWVIIAMIIGFCIVLIRSYRLESRKAGLIQASAVPILVAALGPVVFFWTFSTPDVISLPKVMIAVSVTTTIILVGIFLSMDAGRNLRISESEGPDLRRIRLPQRWGGRQTLSIGRRASAPVRAVRNTGVMLGIMMIILLQANFIKTSALADHFTVNSLPPEAVWALMTSGNITYDGENASMETPEGVTVIFHCDDMTASYGGTLRFSSLAISYVANQACGLSEIPAINGIPVKL